MPSSAYIDLRNGKSKSGKKLEGNAVNCTHKAVTVMLARAVKEGVLDANPCKGADTPKIDTEERMPLTGGDEVLELISSFNPIQPMQIAAILSTTLSLRRGEAVGFSWSGIDFVNGTVNVHHSFDRFHLLLPSGRSSGL